MRRVHAILARSYDPEVASASLRIVRDIMAENDLHACQPRACPDHHDPRRGRCAGDRGPRAA